MDEPEALQFTFPDEERRRNRMSKDKYKFHVSDGKPGSRSRMFDPDGNEVWWIAHSEWEPNQQAGTYMTVILKIPIERCEIKYKEEKQ